MKDDTDKVDPEATVELNSPAPDDPSLPTGTSDGGGHNSRGNKSTADQTVGLAFDGVDSGSQDGIQRFGDYLLLEEIARGGMGVVYKARQARLNRTVALKMILSGRLASDDDVRRFQTEAEAAANLDHSGIVPIYEIGEHDGQHYFSMKLIEGTSLAKAIPQFANDKRAAVELVASLAEAVHHAHQRGILHRDLKPANVLLDEAGKPHITDFGLARQVEGESGLTRTGDIVGTPSYMPPEQARGEKTLTTAADIYSLGVILYELLTGQVPFRGASVMETVLQVLNDEPKSLRKSNPTIDRDLELICLKCLSKNPADRYSSAAGLESDLRHWLSGEPLSVRAPAIASLMRLWLRQNFGAAGWTVVIGLGFGIVAGYLAWTAMLQGDSNIAEGVKAYDKLPNEPRPWLLKFFWEPPEWLKLVCIGLSLFLLGYLGLFTAALVRPKNRNADIAAGLVTGVFAGVAYYLIFLGPASVSGQIFMKLPQDLGLLQREAYIGSNIYMNNLIRQYPDMAELPANERSDVLYMKIIVDTATAARTGVWSGFIASLFMCLIAGIGETFVAGPLVRRYRWYQALLPYTELGLAVVALMVIVTVYTVWRMIVPIAVVDVWLILIIIGALLLAIAGAVRHWHWAMRAALVVAWLPLFTFWLIGGSMEHAPAVGIMQSNIARAQRAIEQNPENVDSFWWVGAANIELGDYWIQYERWSNAVGPLEQSLEGFKQMRGRVR